MTNAVRRFESAGRTRWLWCALLLSGLLHGSVLLLRQPFSRSEGAQRLTVHLLTPSRFFMEEAVKTVPRKVGDRVGHQEKLSDAKRSESNVPVEASKPVSVSSVAGLDMEAVRQQARQLGVGEGREALSRSQAATAREVVPNLDQRPVSPRLAKAVGNLPPIMHEERLADGTRMIRFAGGKCLNIPAHTPTWRDAGVVPTQWVTMNCPH